MFDVAYTELLLVAVVALVVIGPKDLPRAMRFVGQWVSKARGVARHFRTGIDEMIRQAELEEMEKKWAAENERIMREHPAQQQIDHVSPAPPAPAPDTDPTDWNAATDAPDAVNDPTMSDLQMVPLADSAQALLPLDVPAAPKPDAPPRARKPKPAADA